MKRAAITLLLLNGSLAAVSLAGVCVAPLLSSLDWDFARLAGALGILNVLTGFAAALLLMAASQGWRRTWVLLGLCVLLGGGIEMIGTSTGFPFGHYEYTDQLGPKLAGRLPYVIIAAWFMMFYPCLHMAFLCRLPRGLVVGVAAATLTLWDLVLEAAMTTGFPCWEWREDGGFYGIPYQNWLAWFLTGCLIGSIYVVWTREWRADRSPLPIVLYTVQSLFVATLAALYERGLATTLWAMGWIALMAFLLWRLQQPSKAPSPESV